MSVAPVEVSAEALQALKDAVKITDAHLEGTANGKFLTTPFIQTGAPSSLGAVSNPPQPIEVSAEALQAVKEIVTNTSAAPAKESCRRFPRHVGAVTKITDAHLEGTANGKFLTMPYIQVEPTLEIKAIDKLTPGAVPDSVSVGVSISATIETKEIKEAKRAADIKGTQKVCAARVARLDKILKAIEAARAEYGQLIEDFKGGENICPAQEDDPLSTSWEYLANANIMLLGASALFTKFANLHVALSQDAEAIYGLTPMEKRKFYANRHFDKLIAAEKQAPPTGTAPSTLRSDKLSCTSILLLTEPTEPSEKDQVKAEDQHETNQMPDLEMVE